MLRLRCSVFPARLASKGRLPCGSSNWQGAQPARRRILFPSTARNWISVPCFRRSSGTGCAAATLREIARAFQRGIAQGLGDALQAISQNHGLDTVVLSGGVFQNELLLDDLNCLLAGGPLELWTNHAVPPNDGGISLGQAALTAFGRFDPIERPDVAIEPSYA